MKPIRLSLSLGAIWALAAALVSPATTVHAAPSHMALHCDDRATCTEVHNYSEVFGANYYVGHDEPSTLFYSSQPGAGNRMTYRLTLPKDPPPLATNSFNFQLHPAFWFGMAMCDVQSYPQQVSTCTPDSDSNIANNPDPTAPDFMGRHAGTAFMELQFYPPGWAPWPAGNSCDATQWCAALNIDSLSEDPINGTVLNQGCQNLVGVEYVNFAFLTKDGVAQAPANPVQSTTATFTPDASKDLFMGSGDQLVVGLRDSPSGLVTTVTDLTTKAVGSMTSSAANQFGMVKAAPAPSTECTNIPYDFHPMYSTSSEETRVIWAAHSYNIAFSDEIGHFDYCSTVTAKGACAGHEGSPGDVELSDGDDSFCFRADQSTLVQVAGCLGTNTGFDGVPYQTVWPDGDTLHHPTSLLFTSPLSRGADYERMAFEADLPRIEFGVCNRSTGANCTLIPKTDDGAPANFYPFFSNTKLQDTCTWGLGNDFPGVTNDFGRNAQYGPLLQLTYLVFGGQGATLHRYNDFRNVLDSNPCPAAHPGDGEQ